MRDGVYKQPGSQFWYVSYTDSSGRRIRKCSNTTSLTDARRFRAKCEIEAQKRTPTVRETVHELMAAYLAGRKKKRSAERDVFSLKRLYPFFSEKRVSDITSQDIRNYMVARGKEGVGPATINKEITLLSTAINWARAELGWDIINPCAGKRLVEPPARDRWLTREEVERLIAAARTEHLKDFITLSINTGMRSGELLGLDWRRVDFAHNLIYLRHIDQKGNKLSSVPINNSALSVLERRRTYPGDWVFSENGIRIKSIKKGFAAAAKRAELEDVHPHDLRRTCGSWLVQNGVPLQIVSNLLRHSDTRTTERIYAHLVPDQIARAVSVLDALR